VRKLLKCSSSWAPLTVYIFPAIFLWCMLKKRKKICFFIIASRTISFIIIIFLSTGWGFVFKVLCYYYYYYIASHWHLSGSFVSPCCLSLGHIFGRLLRCLTFLSLLRAGFHSPHSFQVDDTRRTRWQNDNGRRRRKWRSWTTRKPSVGILSSESLKNFDPTLGWYFACAL